MDSARYRELADTYAPKFLEACAKIDASAVRLPPHQYHLMAMAYGSARQYVAGQCAAEVFLDHFARFGGEKHGLHGGMVHISVVLDRIFDRMLAGDDPWGDDRVRTRSVD